jgi:hypothetical protein
MIKGDRHVFKFYFERGDVLICLYQLHQDSLVNMTAKYIEKHL